MAKGIEVVCVPLPPAIQLKVDQVVHLASQEVKPAAAAAAVAAEIEAQIDDPTPD